MVVARGHGERGWEVIVKWLEFQFFRMKEVLEVDDCDGYTKIQMYLMQLGCPHSSVGKESPEIQETPV